jgi:UDP-4-amino-4-deoxy-L-arabinose-oxoglutarate aminotransferase
MLGCRHVLAVTSCTGAMHMALLALGIGPGDEVITSSMSFVATANAIIEAGATPVFVDVEADTGNLDSALVEAAITPRTKAILPVHLYGLMCDMAKLREIADRHGLKVIEDAAHCLEGSRDGVRPGNISDAACFSFYATKNMTCGEGGAIAVNDDSLYERLSLLRLHGVTRSAAARTKSGYEPWDMVSFGWKYNLSNIDAAILLPQFDRLAKNLERRHALAHRYDEMLSNTPGIYIPQTRPDSVHARHLYTIWISDTPRDELIGRLRNEGIGCVVNYTPIHLLKWFSDQFGYKNQDFPITEKIGRQTVSLPLFPTMTTAQVGLVASALKTVLESQ